MTESPPYRETQAAGYMKIARNFINMKNLTQPISIYFLSINIIFKNEKNIGY